MTVDGFCDSADGQVFRIRFMPDAAGRLPATRSRTGKGTTKLRKPADSSRARASRRGLIRVDKDHPWHFLWEGTGEHFFWNGTTTYWLLGWDDETIRGNIDRLSRLKVNRLRVAINGRVKDGRAWYENVFPTEKFSFRMNPWVAQRPDSVEDPGFDVTRFNLPHWQKIERMLPLRPREGHDDLDHLLPRRRPAGRRSLRQGPHGRRGRAAVLPVRGGPPGGLLQRDVGRHERIPSLPQRGMDRTRWGRSSSSAIPTIT